MTELLATLASLTTQVLQQQKEPEPTICLALLPPLLGVAALGVSQLVLRLRAAKG